MVFMVYATADFASAAVFFCGQHSCHGADSSDHGSPAGMPSGRSGLCDPAGIRRLSAHAPLPVFSGGAVGDDPDGDLV